MIITMGPLGASSVPRILPSHSTIVITAIQKYDADSVLKLLPVMDEVLAEAKRRGVELIAAPTADVCQLLEEVKKGQAYAILHCTC